MLYTFTVGYYKWIPANSNFTLESAKQAEYCPKEHVRTCTNIHGHPLNSGWDMSSNTTCQSACGARGNVRVTKVVRIPHIGSINICTKSNSCWDVSQEKFWGDLMNWAAGIRGLNRVQEPARTLQPWLLGYLPVCQPLSSIPMLFYGSTIPLAMKTN